MIENERKLKVLVCDDDKSHLFIMRQTLQSEHCEVINAENGTDALSKFESDAPDIVLLDVKMPGLDGFQVCRAIRQLEIGADVPILMITGADDFQSVTEAFACGATDFLSKPINWAMIKHRIKYMLKNYDALISLKASQKTLKHLAYFDALTDLPNRHQFKNSASLLLELAKRNDSKLAIVYINLDNFKRINESLGHQQGDILLQHIAKQIKYNLRRYDLLNKSNGNEISDPIARLGGDEFCLILPNLQSEYEARNICNRIIKSINTPVVLNQREVVITASSGVAVYPLAGNTIEVLLKNADIAMHQAKDKGTNNIEFYIDKDTRDLANILEIEESMRVGIARQEFSVHYQPKVNIDSFDVIGAEALLRWNCEKLGSFPPDVFIPLAEQTGLIIELGDWVLEQVCQDILLIQAKQKHTDLNIAVNVSGRQFCQSDYVDRVKSIITRNGVAPNTITLEITESIMMDDIDVNLAKLSALKAFGVKLSIDDFGTGYSSLSYLKHFPIDEVKIDRTFIVDIAKSKKDAGIVQTIIGLAETLELNAVVEGLETESQLAKIKSISDYELLTIQGYYFYKPMTFEALLKLYIENLALHH